MSTTTVSSDKDNTMFQIDPTDNDGTNVRLFLKNESSNNLRILLNFTIPTSIESSQITSAHLLMNMVLANAVITPWQAHRIVPVWQEISSSWEEVDTPTLPAWVTAGAAHPSSDINSTPTPISGTVPAGQENVYDFGEFKNFVIDAIDNRSRRLSLRLARTGSLSSDGPQFHSRESISGPAFFPRLSIFTSSGGGGFIAASHFEQVLPRMI